MLVYQRVPVITSFINRFVLDLKIQSSVLGLRLLAAEVMIAAWFDLGLSENRRPIVRWQIIIPNGQSGWQLEIH